MPFTNIGTQPMGMMGGGGGGGFNFGQLFSNPLILQLMSSMGASLDPEGPAGKLNQMNQQWIQTQNYRKMMQKMLAGGGKVTMDGKGTTINIPTSALSTEEGGGSSMSDWMNTMYPENKGLIGFGGT